MGAECCASYNVDGGNKKIFSIKKWEEQMKLILRLVIDDIDRHDLNWKDRDFIEIVAATLKNPHGYDDVEALDMIFDGRERKFIIKKENNEHIINLKVWKECQEDKSVLIAEIWPIMAAVSI
jgi:hypothetical protein